MATDNETIESLTKKLKESEEKNVELSNKVTELNSFIQKQNVYIKKLKDELSEKEAIILQQQKNSEGRKQSTASKSPKTPLSVHIPSQGKVSYKYSKISSPVTDNSYNSISQLSPVIHVEHIRHSSTEDNITSINEPRRKPSFASRLIKESKFSVSENNIIYNPNPDVSTESLIKQHSNVIEDNESNLNSSSNDFEDREVLSDEITVYIQKLLIKKDKNKKDVSFIISIRSADSGDELWKIEKTYTDIVNLENNV